jgi:serine/threonine protein kinase/tetratricopeptide (TPR) repeat protein
MKLGPATDSSFATLEEPQICEQCHTVSRLTNGLCLNCLLHGALEKDETPSGKEAFREVLAGVRSGTGDWRIAEHEILEEIARGGMGVVYRAREPHSDRIVALKCVLAYQGGDSDHLVARFRREAEMASRLEHPNIVPIYQVGETADGFPYYTMKLAAAGSLVQAREALRKDPRRSAALMMKVARAVHFAHEQGVLHRDLKPGNILLEGHGEPLVSDFGLARCEAVSGYLTRSLASFGTPGYIAPEQADGPAAQLTPAADVYSLGAVLFELLTGRTPFVGDNAFAVMKQSAEAPAPKLRSLVPKADRDLEIICARCLEREPTDRYQSAAMLADDLEAWLDDRPIAASAPGPWLRSRRWVRRNRMLAASLLALGLLVAGSVVWQLRSQRIQHRMEEGIVAAHSVVVLPFLNLDTIESDEIATETVATLLRTRLQNLGPSRVVTGTAPTASRMEEIRKAAQAVNGRTLLTGTVRNVKGSRRVSLHLLNAVTGQAFLTTSFEENNADQKIGECARQVYTLLTADKWPDVESKDPGLRNAHTREAIDAGRNYYAAFSVSSLNQAIDLFKKAISEEPNSAAAHALLAMAALARTYLVADSTYLDLGRKEALKAQELDPNLLEVHRAMVSLYFQEGKFHAALEEHMRIIEISGLHDRPVGSITCILDQLGRTDLSLQWSQIALRLQERPGEIETAIGDYWTRLGNDEQAFLAYNRAMELLPGSAQVAAGKAHLHLWRGEFDLARAICEERVRNGESGDILQMAAQIEFFAGNNIAAEKLYTKLMQSDPQGGGAFYGAITYQSALGRIKQARGEDESATALLKESLARETATFEREPSNPHAVYRLAAVEASLNLTDSAFQHLHQAITLGWLDYRSLQRDPRLDSVRKRPEFDTLVDGVSARAAELRNNAEKMVKKK